jgi:succinate dehydrogenase/fumarate reductase flavoprotein subunit
MMNHIECDVLCIGAGGAGLVAGITAARAGANVVVISKGPYGCGNTRIAAGLVLRPNISPKDSPDALMRDMLVGGDFLNHQPLVEKFCERAHLAAELMERFGLIFSRGPAGQLVPLPIPLGGHSLPRTLSGYSEGVPIGTALRGATAASGIHILDETMALRLFKTGNSVTGALCLNKLSGEIIPVIAKQTILATGGLGWLFYPHTSNTHSMTGDGFALALEVGAELIDMEQQQFIPFALTYPDSMVGIICGEPAIAGPYGRLVDAKGNNLLKNIRTRTRAEASAAIALAEERGAATVHGGALLDLSQNLDKVLGKKMFEFLKRTFPAMIEGVKRAYGDDAAAGKIPWDVFPTAHYQMGGVRVDTDCRVRGLKNMFAIGEVQGGLHGANRIGSTSLAELFVFGSLAGECAAEAAKTMTLPVCDSAAIDQARARAEELPGKPGKHNPLELQRELQSVLWEKVGPLRDASRLEAAIDRIAELSDMRISMSIPPHRDFNVEWIAALELEQMLIVAEAIARSAIARTESRGGHFRLDHPERDDKNWLKNVVVRQENKTLSAEPKDVSLSKFGLNAKGGPNPVRDRIQFIFLNLLPEKLQAKILNARLNLGEDS